MLPEFAPSDFKALFVDDLSNEAYHKDKSCVSSTALKTILKSPATFYAKWTDRDPFTQTDAMRFGSLVHMAVLEPHKFFATHIRIPDFGDQRTTKNRAAKEDYLSSLKPGTMVVTESDYIKLEGIVNSVLSNVEASNLLKHGKAESSGFYRDPVTSIKCRIRPDFFNEELMALVDLKTTVSCEKAEFEKSIWNYRYDFQMAMYCEAIRNITGRDVNYAIFLAIEKTPPYEVALYVADQKVRDHGTLDYYRALQTLQACLLSNKWYPYQRGLQEISLPPWIKE